MSESKKETENTSQKPEKVVTKYDLKMQRRKEEKAREQKEKQMGTVTGIVVVAALACLVASFPIRSWITVHGTYVEVDGEKVPKVEFDYNYNVVSNSFISQNYTMYYYYMGVDLMGDLSTQMYSDTLSWKDYFEGLAVDNIARNKALAREARAEGFVHDVTEEYNEYMEELRKTASEAGTSTKEYIQRLYGVYATESRVRPFIEEAMYTSAYGDVVSERMTPSQEDIQAYYEGNTASYDSVDYYVTMVEAELPTEPTELADPVDETEAAGDQDAGADTQTGADGQDAEETPYQPSEAEIEAAMEAAKKEADGLESGIMTSGELASNARQSDIAYLLRDWLFDETRKEGDTTVIEDSTNHRYYVLGFERRYLDQTPTVNIRTVMTTGENGQEILDEWKNGAATEESFAEICDKYNDASVTSAEGGLLEGVSTARLADEMRDWLSGGTRAAGDTAVISPEGEGYTYVMYYLGTNEAEWILSIRSTLLNEKVSEYMDALIADMDVKDPKGNLNFLKVEAEEENDSTSGESGDASSGNDDAPEGGDSSESGDASDGADAGGAGESGTSESSSSGGQ